jgi:large subunit ribosomal protein L1
MNQSKAYKQKLETIGPASEKQGVDLNTGVSLLKKVAKDWESVDLAVRLGINTRKADQNIRGTTVLPKGTGRTATVIVFCKEDKVAEAKEAGADYVGLEDLIEKVSGGWTDFDMAIATPDVMKDVSKVAKVLGPRGLMPNPKSGTVTADIAGAIAEIKAGKVEYRADKTGIIHSSVGRASFSEDDLRENVAHLIHVLLRAKPSTVKGQYVKSIFLSTTQSPGVKLDPGNFSV